MKKIGFHPVGGYVTSTYKYTFYMHYNYDRLPCDIDALVDYMREKPENEMVQLLGTSNGCSWPVYGTKKRRFGSISDNPEVWARYFRDSKSLAEIAIEFNCGVLDLEFLVDKQHQMIDSGIAANKLLKELK